MFKSSLCSLCITFSSGTRVVSSNPMRTNPFMSRPLIFSATGVSFIANIVNRWLEHRVVYSGAIAMPRHFLTRRHRLFIHRAVFPAARPSPPCARPPRNKCWTSVGGVMESLIAGARDMWPLELQRSIGIGLLEDSGLNVVCELLSHHFS